MHAPANLEMRSILSTGTLLLATTVGLYADVGAQGSDKLIRDFERWYRSDWSKKPERATFVLNRLRQRGGYEDGRRVVRVLLKSVKGRVAGRIRDGLARALRTRATKPGIRSAVLEALLDKSRVVRRKGKVVRLHSQPDVVRRLLPLIAIYEPVKHLEIIQSYARNDEPAIYMAAAEAVRVADHAHGIPVLLTILKREEDTRRLRTVSRWFVELWSRRARQLPAKQRVEVTAQLEEHLRSLPMREAIDFEHKALLLPALMQIRAKSTVPALIGELETAYKRWRRPGRHPVPIGVSRWMHAVRDCLVDFTGFSAGAGQVASWKDFWRREQKKFAVRAKPAFKPTTSRDGFFGVRLRGRRVVFVIDASTSMKRSLQEPPRQRRIDRARDEVLKALGTLDAECSFRIVMFNEEVIRFPGRGFSSVTQYQLKRLRTWFKNAPVGGRTNLLDALEIGLKDSVFAKHIEQRRSVDECFVVSDGVPDDRPKRVYDELSTWMNKSGCRLHVVCLGVGDGKEKRQSKVYIKNHPGIAFLERLAGRHRGEFRVLP